MKKRHTIRRIIVAVVSATFFAVVVVAVGRLRPPVHVGATKEELQARFQAEELRRLPPYARTCGQLGATPNEWFVGTEFYLREEHVFAVRRVALTFSTSGVVSEISSRWEWRWSL